MLLFRKIRGLRLKDAGEILEGAGKAPGCRVQAKPQLTGKNLPDEPEAHGMITVHQLHHYQLGFLPISSSGVGELIIPTCSKNQD